MNKREFWSGHVEACCLSDCSQASYCRQHGLSIKSFYRWKSRLKLEAQELFLDDELATKSMSGFAVAQLELCSSGVNVKAPTVVSNPALEKPSELVVSLPSGINISGVNELNAHVALALAGKLL